MERPESNNEAEKPKLKMAYGRQGPYLPVM